MSDQLPNDPNKKLASIRTLVGNLLDGGRIKVTIELVDNQGILDLELELKDSTNQVISHALIMGTVDQHIEFTLHFRTQNPVFPLTLTGSIFIAQNLVDSKNIEIPAP